MCTPAQTDRDREKERETRVCVACSLQLLFIPTMRTYIGNIGIYMYTDLPPTVPLLSLHAIRVWLDKISHCVRVLACVFA